MTKLLRIGALARLAGVPVRTLRFWSDEGLVPVASRTRAGYRVYGADAVARLELVRTLRELGLGLDPISEVLRRKRSVAEVATTHADALDARIRLLRMQRSILRLVAERDASAEEIPMMNELARASASEKRRILDDFVAKTFEGIAEGAPGTQIADRMRSMSADLPDDPSVEQVEAWVELAGLVADPAFVERVRAMALAGASSEPPPGPAVDPSAVQKHAGAALASGIAPTSTQAREVVARILGAELSRQERAELADRLSTFADLRVERYWQLLGVLNGRPPFPPQVPAFVWLIEALRSAP